jgi:hypothetical protein
MQKQKRDLYLGGKYMADYNSETLAIANSWLDPEVRRHKHKKWVNPSYDSKTQRAHLLFQVSLFRHWQAYLSRDSATRVHYPVHTC